MSVVIGWIDGGDVKGDFAECIAKLSSYETARGRMTDILRIRTGPQMPEGRNLVIEGFLKTDGEWLFMVDSDMVFPHNSVERLLESADPEVAPMVGGLCFAINKEFGQYPTLYRDIDGLPAVHFDIPAEGLMEVDATGAAFLLTHRSVFEENEREGSHRWFHRVEVEGNGRHPGGWLSEDISWCRWLRSRGVPIFVDVGLEVGHVKPMTIGRVTYAREQK